MPFPTMVFLSFSHHQPTFSPFFFLDENVYLAVITQIYENNLTKTARMIIMMNGYKLGTKHCCFLCTVFQKCGNHGNQISCDFKGEKIWITFLFLVLSLFKKGDTIQGGTLYKGEQFLRKYGT